jgi:hypothetical protein
LLKLDTRSLARQGSANGDAEIMGDTTGDVEGSGGARLFVVQGTFTVFGRGIALLPGVPKYEPGPRVAPGMSIELRRPDGTILATTIRAIEWFQTAPQRAAPLQLPPEIAKEEVPDGTEVWLTDAYPTL